MQKLITNPIRATLVANYKQAVQIRASLDENGDEQDIDFVPALKLFCPWGGATWLISELDPETNIAYGLADLGHGCAELGLIPIGELSHIRHPSGLRIERDINFKANGKKLNAYAADARELGYIAA